MHATQIRGNLSRLNDPCWLDLAPDHKAAQENRLSSTVTKAGSAGKTAYSRIGQKACSHAWTAALHFLYFRMCG